MPRLTEKLAKLRGRSTRELAVRSVQAVSIGAERLRLSPQTRLPGDRTFLRRLRGWDPPSGSRGARAFVEHFRTRPGPAFFPAFTDPDATLAALRSRWPDAAEAAVRRAEEILAGRFRLLGWDELRFGDRIDWHLDPVSGRRAPLVHWSRIPFLDPAVVGDHKTVWELNRHQYLITLGKAYWYTGDERYAAAFADHLTAWMDANPPKRGINWASSLELAFRSISWIWALHFFRDSAALTPEIFLRACKFLELHGRHIERYLSTYFSPNTHLTGEALGLFYLGTMFPEFRTASRWRKKGLRILTDQLDVQVRADGVYFEQATYYHRYTCDFYLHLRLLSRANGEAVDPRLEAKLQALLDHLMYLTRPDGSVPLLGDDDGGRLLPLDEDDRGAADFRSTLASGAILFRRPDYRYVAGEATEEALWLSGSEGLRVWDALEPAEPPRSSVAFPDGGYFAMRDGWGTKANSMLVDCGPHGAMNCGHAHADALAFELVARGTPVLIDPGTYTYTASREKRDRLRSSLAHNTVAVDGESSSVPDGPFQWIHVAECSPRRWSAAERFDFFRGAHDGYARLPAPATHERSILFLKGEYWIVRDRIVSDGEHRMDLRFRFAPAVRVSLVGNGTVLADTADDVRLQLSVVGTADPPRIEDAPVSCSYGKLADAPSCVFTTRAVGNQELVSVLVPGAASAPPVVVTSRKAAGGRILVCRTAQFEDWLALTNGSGAGGMEDPEVRSDFGWAWLRRGESDDVLREFVLIDGRRLEWRGGEVFRSELPVRHLAAFLQDGELRVEADADGPFTLHALGAGEVRVNGTRCSVQADGFCTVGTEGPVRKSTAEEDDTILAGVN